MDGGGRATQDAKAESNAGAVTEMRITPNDHFTYKLRAYRNPTAVCRVRLNCAE